MWARRCGAPAGWPSRVKVIVFSFFSGTLGLSIYMYMAGSNISYLDLEHPTSKGVRCLADWPLRNHAISWSTPKEWLMFFAPTPDIDAATWEYCAVAASAPKQCSDIVVPVHQMKRPLAIALGDEAAGYDVLGLWARFFLCITFTIWLGMTTHDLALIGRAHKDFILDATGVNEHCPSIRRVWRSLAGHRVLVRLLSHKLLGLRVLGTVVGVTLAPVAVVWNLVVFNFVVVPLLLLAFLRYPIRMSRAWVFIVCVACSLYGLALTVQQLAFVMTPVLRPQYALTWQPELKMANATTPTGVSPCTCGCDYPVSISVCVNLTIIGVVTTVKSIFLALRCLKGLRRSQWANLLSVMFPVPITLYTVDWRLPNGLPIRYRTQDVPVQGEVAFDPFAMMDEQLDSAFTTVHLRPEPVHRYQRNHSGELVVLTNGRVMEMPGIPVPSFCAKELQVRKVEYVGCCGFPWPTGGKQCVYDPAFMAQLDEGSIVESPRHAKPTISEPLSEEEESRSPVEPPAGGGEGPRRRGEGKGEGSHRLEDIVLMSQAEAEHDGEGQGPQSAAEISGAPPASAPSPRKPRDHAPVPWVEGPS